MIKFHWVHIYSPTVLTLPGEKVNNLVRSNTHWYAYIFHFTNSASQVRFGMFDKKTSGVEFGGGASASSQLYRLAYVEVDSRHQVEFRSKCVLHAGVYFLNAGVVGDVAGSEGYLHRLIDIAMFRVLPDSENLATGIVDFGCYPEIELQQTQY